MLSQCRDQLKSISCYNQIMNYLKDLFSKGRYHIYIGFAVLIQTQRSYLLPHTNLYASVRKSALEELFYIDPEHDYKELVLQKMSENDKNKLKSNTKKQVEQIQSICSSEYETLPITGIILTLGAINYYIHPTFCAIFVGGYLSLLAVDYLKSLSVIKFSMDPMWQWKMKNVGYLMACGFGFITTVLLASKGIAKLKQNATKALILRNQTKQ